LGHKTAVLKEIGKMKFFRSITGVRPQIWDTLIKGKRFDNIYRLIVKYHDNLPADAIKERGQLRTIFKNNKWLIKALNEVKDLAE
jgi:hypothetical protein